MIKCLIVEDEPLARDILLSYIDELPELKLIASCKSAVEAVDVLKKETVDVIFLDINMPKLSGISFYKSLVHRPKVIFTTAYAEYAVEGFDLDAVDYLLKPFSFERFKKAVSKLGDPANSSGSISDYIMLKADKKVHKVGFDQISHFESSGDYMIVHLEESKNLIIHETLKNLEEELPEHLFMRVHKSFIISIEKLKYIEGNQIQLSVAKVPIGQSYREKVNESFKK